LRSNLQRRIDDASTGLLPLSQFTQFTQPIQSTQSEPIVAIRSISSMRKKYERSYYFRNLPCCQAQPIDGEPIRG
jgi:hypothetical protein